jgi:cytochrome b6-f complex iron-sulfur subunit
MPKKIKEKVPQAEPPRRSFLTKLWLALGFIALAEFIAVAISFLRPDKSKALQENNEAVIIAGSVGNFVPNTVTAFVHGRFYLARLKDGGFLALSRKCTHLGCTVPWVEKEEKFVCPCHASAFDIKGDVLHAPAPRALDIYPVVIENDIVKVDTGRPMKRSEFRKDQVVFPEKTA